jgi:hypothetical protein
MKICGNMVEIYKLLDSINCDAWESRCDKGFEDCWECIEENLGLHVEIVDEFGN